MNNFQSHSFNDGCLTYTGFTDKNRVIFSTTVKNFTDTFYIFISTNNTIDFTFASHIVQVNSTFSKQTATAALSSFWWSRSTITFIRTFLLSHLSSRLSCSAHCTEQIIKVTK